MNQKQCVMSSICLVSVPLGTLPMWRETKTHGCWNATCSDVILLPQPSPQVFTKSAPRWVSLPSQPPHEWAYLLLWNKLSSSNQRDHWREREKAFSAAAVALLIYFYKFKVRTWLILLHACHIKHSHRDTMSFDMRHETGRWQQAGGHRL